MPTKLITAPTEYPITVAEAKAQCRVEHTAEDDLIQSLIAAATDYLEIILRRQLVTATWETRLDCFEDIIELPKPNLLTVVTIKYIDIDGVEQTIDEADYVVDTFSQPGRVYPAYNTCWPSHRDELNAVRIRFTAGYGLAASVPEAVKHMIKLLVGHWYLNREDVVTGTISSQLQRSVNDLADAYRFVGL